MRLTCLLFSIGLFLGCGASPRTAAFAEDDDLDLAGRPALQMYLVLTEQTDAMQSKGDVQAMWSAVHGDLPGFQEIRRAVRWAPANYKIDIELDFADLPHPALPRTRLTPLLRRLPASAGRRAEKARLAVSVRSRSESLPDGEHLRLIGAAVLHIAERYDGIIIDLLAQRAWSPAAWRREISGPRLSSRQTRLVSRRTSQGVQLRTRGHLKYGLPDLELNVRETELSEGKVALARAQGALLRRGPGGLQSSLSCRGAGYDGECIRLVLPTSDD